jgi:ubiquinone/menaquinone biosynthesis C-methylase UbiE
MHERRFEGDISRLRSAERVARLEIGRVVQLSLEGTPVTSVIDIGTGTGLFAEAFAARNLVVAGVDASPDMLEAAKRFVPQGEFHESLAEALPFPNRSYDLAFLGMVLHETDDPLQALREARRVARLRVAILEWPYQPQEFGPPLEHRLKPDQIDSLFQKAGLHSIKSDLLSNLILYLADL